MSHSQPHHALLFIMTALPWQCLLQMSLLAAAAAAESCLKVRGDGPRVYHWYGPFVSMITTMSPGKGKGLGNEEPATDGSTMLAPMSLGAGKGF